MFEFVSEPEERGQVGIGTLIVFIAMVLVAAIAAGVLINTAGFLQTKSQATGQESTAQVSNRVQVIDAFGSVNGANDTINNDTIDFLNISVMRSSGADNINLSRSTIQWIGPEQATTLVHNGTVASHENLTATTFTTENVDATSDFDEVLSDEDTRIKIVIYTPEVKRGSEIQDPANNLPIDPHDDNINGLTEGQEVQLTITTQYGSQTQYVVNVPESLQGKNAVAL